MHLNSSLNHKKNDQREIGSRDHQSGLTLVTSVEFSWVESNLIYQFDFTIFKLENQILIPNFQIPTLSFKILRFPNSKILFSYPKTLVPI